MAVRHAAHLYRVGRPAEQKRIERAPVAAGNGVPDRLARERGRIVRRRRHGGRRGRRGSGGGRGTVRIAVGVGGEAQTLGPGGARLGRLGRRRMRRFRFLSTGPDQRGEREQTAGRTIHGKGDESYADSILRRSRDETYPRRTSDTATSARDYTMMFGPWRPTGRHSLPRSLSHTPIYPQVPRELGWLRFACPYWTSACHRANSRNRLQSEMARVPF